MLRKITVFAFLMPIVVYAVSLYGGYEYSFAPKDNITSDLGLFVGAEHELGPVSIRGGYRYADSDIDWIGTGVFPDEQPVHGWKTHTVKGGVKYNILRYRVSPYVAAEMGLVWYSYFDVLGRSVPNPWGGVVPPDPDDGPAFMFSISGGADVSIWGPVGCFGEFGYERHFLKLLRAYGYWTGEYRYMDIEYWGLGISAGLTIDVL